MKRKIIIVLSLCALVLFFGGARILYIIDRTTDKLDRLVMLHQVEILREHYLLEIRRVQTDLTLRGTKFAPDFPTTAGHVASMDRVVGACFDCHHTPPVAQRIRTLRDHTRRYEESLSRVITFRANAERIESERDAAFRNGEELIQDVSDMIAMTGARLGASTERALAEIASMKRALIVILAAGPICSLVLGLLLVRGISKPMQALLAATRRLKRGELDYRVTGLKDEFAELGNAFNEMGSSIRDQIAKRERAEKMAMLGQVSAGLAHEIKNPLAGIKAAMEVLSLEVGFSEEDRDVLRKVRQEAGRVEALMKTFLNFARPPKPQPAHVDVPALVSSCVALYARESRPTPSGGHVEVHTNLTPVPVISTDPMQLEQVLINLILNAYDAMPSGGRLTVTTRLAGENGDVCIDVEDTGRGIPPESLAKIFEPFYTTKPRGTGLGLAISRQLIEQQGGTLTVASTVGAGTVFTITLDGTGVEAHE